ncbi:hypothetical protein AGOR_G00100780 [Albula goreensis]|uniref:Cilia- and flagella-associated protein 36 n=1 Tax=Albula goreensis TaxID=1534307 RepID=A0A8T3DPX4_9TELE|nr:hypothetical protein AGOR_G00100780 [Albula goreensis]
MADDSEWIVESIAGYLGSPEWVIPVTDFMEHKCTVFDDEDENKLSYTEIHQQYKQLVEKLLESYMKEVGISEHQFLEACSSPFAKSKAVQAVFQPVVATDDFQLFKSLMVQKNMELQLQALRVMEERNGMLPDCLTDGVDSMGELEQQELCILKEVLRRSKEEYEQEMAIRTLSDDETGSCSTSSSDRMVVDHMDTPPARDTPPAEVIHTSQMSESSVMGRGEGERADGRDRADSGRVCPKPAAGRGSGSKVLGVLRVPVKGVEPKMSGSQAAESWLEEAWREAGISKSFTELSEVQQEQLQQRALYLRQQRDKLQALRKEQQPKPTKELSAAPVPAPASLEISMEEKKRLQKRKQLAEKLKEEVIKK